MPTTMQLIAKQTVGSSGASSVTFSSIPDSFTDLKIVVSARTTTANPLQAINLTFNSSRTTNQVRLYQYSGTAASNTNVGDGQGEGGFANGNTTTSNTFSSGELYIPNYRSTNSKSYLNESVTENNSSSDTLTFMVAGLNTSVTVPITSITLTPSADLFSQFSEFTLYGISNSTTTQNPTTPYATGGDAILKIGSYWYHAFIYSGTFTPAKELNCDILVVGGGGGGGGTYGGGGGAGAIQGSPFFATQLLTATPKTVTVGAGGIGSRDNTSTGSNGTSSSFVGTSTITALGGGGGAGATGSARLGASGGSGGGTWYGINSPGGSASGLNTNAGGAGHGNYALYGARGGGGGGATSAGASGAVSGNGGQGATLTTIDSNLTASNFTLFAGMTVISSGGGGASETGSAGAPGTGGTGAGNGGIVQFPTLQAGGNATSFGSGGGAGVVDTGGGGSNAYGGNGFQGIVMVRYAV